MKLTMLFSVTIGLFLISVCNIEAQQQTSNSKSQRPTQGSTGDINSEAFYGLTNLMLAALKGQTNSVKALLSQGAEVNRKNSTDGLTALMCAAYGGNIETIRLLLTKGANVNVHDTGENTAIDYAAVGGHIEVAKELKAKGATLKKQLQPNANGLDLFLSVATMPIWRLDRALGKKQELAETSGAGSEAVEKFGTNYSGTWKLNVEKSDFGPFGPFPPVKHLTQRIRHENLILQVSIKQNGEQGELSDDLKYIIDGGWHINKMTGQEIESRAKWSGDTLQIRSTVVINGTLFVITDEWALSKDGRVLTVNRHQSAPGARDFKQVFEKQ